MASHSSDPRRNVQRRESSRSSTSRRPRLMRACATEPSITTSNVSRGPVPTQSNKRATDLLSQVAYVSGSPPDSLYRGSSRSSTQSTIYDRLDTARAGLSGLADLDGLRHADGRRGEEGEDGWMRRTLRRRGAEEGGRESGKSSSGSGIGI